MRLAAKPGPRGESCWGLGVGDFFFFFVRPERQGKVREALRNLVEVPFRFESGGSRLVYFRHPADGS